MKVAEPKVEEAIDRALLEGDPDACAAGGWIREERTPYGDVPGGYRRRARTTTAGPNMMR